MATLRPSYGTKTNLTISLNSLANASARASTAVDNTSELAGDVHVGGKLTAPAASTNAAGYCNVWAYGGLDGGTTYSDAASGTDAAHTMNGNAMLLGVVVLDANNEVAEFGPFSLAAAFGGTPPPSWGVIVENRIGASLHTSGHEVHYRIVNYVSS